MAAATSTLTVNAHPYGVDNTQRRQIVHGVCGLSASGTYSTNGVPLSWTALVSADGSKFIPQSSPQTTQPADCSFFSKVFSGYTYVYDQTHNTLRIASGGTELANAAAITADTIGFEAEFVRNY